MKARCVAPGPLHGRSGFLRLQALREAQVARGLGYHAVEVGRPGRLAVAITGGTSKPPVAPLEALPRVRSVIDAPNPWYLASRAYEDTAAVRDAYNG